MSKRWYYDPERGMPTIRPAARPPLPPPAVKLWAKTGVRAIMSEVVAADGLDRCPTCGRAWDCCCPDCIYCDGMGRPRKVT